MTVLDSYALLEQELKEQHADLSIPEIHGMMTGWLCIKTPQKNDWEYTLFAELDITPTFRHIFEGIYSQLCSDNLAFNILISPDDSSLSLQAKDLALWCQGFLLGLGLSGVKTDMDSVVDEAIDDITKISQIDFKAVTNSNENEQDLLELIEFVRTAVMIIFNTLHAGKNKKTHH